MFNDEAILEDGSNLEADLVLAADGVGGKWWCLVSGKKEEPVSEYFPCKGPDGPLQNWLIYTVSRPTL